MRLRWPFTGRSVALASVRSAIADPTTSGVVISGAAGVGKSRVAREALETAAREGCETRWVVGTSSARALPLGAMAAWATPALGENLQLVCGVIDSLTATTSSAGVVLGVDDAHLLDDLSIFVVQQIVQRRAAKVVLTIREGEPIPVGIEELWKDAQLEWVDLQPFSLEETTTLLTAALTGAVDRRALARLWELSRGNVLYLRHIVEPELSDGRLREEHGMWRWLDEPVIPSGLTDLIESRIAGMPAPVGVVVDTLAVGEPVDLGALRRIAGPDAVEEADEYGLISLQPNDVGVEVRLAHPLYGEVRRRRAPPTRLRRLRGLVATELAGARERDELQAKVRRATLLLDSDLEPDAALMAQAAQGAVGLGDLALAERLAHVAVHAGAGPEAAFTRAHALSWLGRGEEAAQILAGIPAEQLSEDDCARLTYLQASNALWALGEPDRTKGIIDRAPAVTSSRARTCMAAVNTVYQFAIDEHASALLASQGVVFDDLPAIVGAETAWVLSAIYADAGRTSDSLAVADIGYALATRCSDAPQMRFNIADAHVGALLLAGRIREAEHVADRVRAESADLPGAAHFLGAAIAGRAALGAGRLEEACDLLESSTAALSAVGFGMGWGFRYLVPYATALAMRGSTDAAVAVLSALDASHRPFRALEYERKIARAWLAAGQGALSQAIAMLHSAAQGASTMGAFAAEVMCLQTAAQFGDRCSVSRLQELERSVEGPRAALAARLATAVRDGDGGELATVSDAFGALGDGIAEVDAAALAAIAYRGDDRRGSALTLAARAEGLAHQCGGAETPKLRECRDPLPFTDREREIVMLIGEGASNPEIAARLYLSTRTVEGHIYRAMKKTGTASREELAALVHQPKTAGRD